LLNQLNEGKNQNITNVPKKLNVALP